MNTKMLDEVMGNEIEVQISELRLEYDTLLETKANIESKLSKLKQQQLKLDKKSYYVYVVVVDGEVKYIGKGKGDRYKHAVSGSSSVPELNKDYFNGKLIEVRIVHGNRNLTEKEAISLEADYIGSHSRDIWPSKLYNKLYPTKFDSWDINLIEWSELVIDNRGSTWKNVSM